MSKYVLSYYGGGAAMTDEERAKVMEKWGAWFGTLGSAVVDPGLPYSGVVKSVSPGGATADGAIGERATGYSILEAESADHAVQLAKGCPVLESGGSIAVYETAAM